MYGNDVVKPYDGECNEDLFDRWDRFGTFRILSTQQQHNIMIARISIISALLFLGAASAFAPVNSPSHAVRTKLNLAVGEEAPNFALVDQNSKTIRRSHFKKPLVVYFYPADFTPGCTKETEGFNNSVEEIRKKYGAEVVGVSGQNVASHKKFAKELGLKFSILADVDDKVRKSFEVPKAAHGLDFVPGRVTYVLDKEGVCISVRDDLSPNGHVLFAKRALADIDRKG